MTTLCGGFNAHAPIFHTERVCPLCAALSNNETLTMALKIQRATVGDLKKAHKIEIELLHQAVLTARVANQSLALSIQDLKVRTKKCAKESDDALQIHDEASRAAGCLVLG